MKGRLAMGLRERFEDPKDLATITFALAVAFSVVVSASLIYASLLHEYFITVNGDVYAKVSLPGALGEPLSNKGLVIYSVRDPLSRPGIWSLDRSYPMVKYLLLSFDDGGSVVNGIPLIGCNVTIKSKGNNIIANYFYHGNLIATKVVVPQDLTVIFHGKVERISLYSRLPLKIKVIDKNTLKISSLLPFMNYRYNITLGFENCKVLSAMNTYFNATLINLDSNGTCIIKIKEVNGCFVGTTERGERACYPSPYYSRTIGMMLNGFANYLIIVLMPILAIILWKFYISKNLTNVKGVAAYGFTLALLGSITALHWDAVMSYIFASKAFDPVGLYAWTRHFQIAVKLKIPSHYPLFPGYTYVTPWIAILLSPLSIVVKLFDPKGFIHVFAYDEFLMGVYTSWNFRTSYLMYYLALGLWYALFNVITYLVGKRVFDEKDVLLFLYSPFTAVVSYYWKMFEPMLIALFLTLLYLLTKKKGTVLSGGIAAIVMTKVYPTFAIIPLLKVLRPKEILMAMVGFIIFLIPAIITILNLGLKKFLFITLYYQSHREIAAVNFFPIVMPEILEVVRIFGNISTLIEVSLFLLLFIEFIKRGKIRDVREYLAWSIVLMVPYLMFNKLVSPQNYLFLLMFTYLLKMYSQANLLSLILTAYVALVFPTVFYFALPLIPMMGKTYYLSRMSPLYLVFNVYLESLRPIMWTVLVVSLFAVDVVIMGKALSIVKVSNKDGE